MLSLFSSFPSKELRLLCFLFFLKKEVYDFLKISLKSKSSLSSYFITVYFQDDTGIRAAGFISWFWLILQNCNQVLLIRHFSTFPLSFSSFYFISLLVFFFMILCTFTHHKQWRNETMLQPATLLILLSLLYCLFRI